MADALLRSAVAALSLTFAAPSVAQEVASTMGPEQLAEALRLVADDKVAGRFLDTYIVQPRREVLIL